MQINLLNDKEQVKVHIVISAAVVANRTNADDAWRREDHKGRPNQLIPLNVPAFLKAFFFFAAKPLWWMEPAGTYGSLSDSLHV